MRRLAAGIAIAGLFLSPASALAAEGIAPLVPQEGAEGRAIDETLKSITLPLGFRIARFAIVPHARAMAVSPNGGTVFVGTTGNQVYALKLESPHGPALSVKPFAPALAKQHSHGVCFSPDGTLYLAELNRILAFPDAADQAERNEANARSVVAPGELIPASEESPYHSMRVCRVGPDGKLYVTIGQHFNVPPPDKWAEYELLGLGAIIRMNTDGSHREIYATGIRNSVGLDFNPKDGTLWFTDNQVDRMGDDIPPGELNRATKAGQHFGFPWYGGGHTRTNEYKDSTPPEGVVFPEIEMVAHAADLGMTFYRGVTFPERYRGIFSVQHGSWNRTTPVGARVMFTTLKADGTADKTTPFAEGWLRPDGGYAGRPADVAMLADGSLLVSDDGAGAIYRISYEGVLAGP